MKWNIILLLLFAVVMLLQPSTINSSTISICNQGPDFWCSSLSNAKTCGAVTHCIQTVWTKEEIQEDNDSVCQICLDMVKQARDELQSNETLDNLKAVFDGTCKLIPIKPVQKECIKVADNFIPELVEALSSQMNPQMVCSVAGLCNNAAIDVLIEAYEKEKAITEATASKSTANICDNCHNATKLILKTFQKNNQDDIKHRFTIFCGQLSSYSDSCYQILNAHFVSFYEYFRDKVSAEGLCHLTGVCSFKYHSHAESSTAIGFTSNANGDDLPCELCEQLVKHLRDVLIANTTEDEFKQVLQGLCGQTKSFKSQCLSIVDEHYKTIYEALVSNLDANGACFLIGICPKGYAQHGYLIPPQPVKMNATIKAVKKLGENELKLSADQINLMQLPFVKLNDIGEDRLVENGQLCTLCEYFLHFVQETLTLPSNEEKLKKDFDNICKSHMPKTLSAQCQNFVDMYGDAVIALLIQEIEPKEICPKLKFCNMPKAIQQSKESTKNKTTTCPLCLFAVEQAQIKIKDDKSEKHVEEVLNNLCKHLNNKLKKECEDFVATYSKELVEKLVNDFTPQQICAALKLCPPEGGAEEIAIEIVEKEAGVKRINAPLPECLLCKKIVELIEKEIGEKKSKEEIVIELKNICHKLKPNIENKCLAFINKNGEYIAELLLNEVEPASICRDLFFCSQRNENFNIETSVPEKKTVTDSTCTFCELVMAKLELDLKDKKTQDEIKNSVLHICHKMPATLKDKCDHFIQEYSDLIINMLEKLPPKEICKELSLCPSHLHNGLLADVLDCGVCHGLTEKMFPTLKNNGSNENILENCEIFEAKHYKLCFDFLATYFESLKNLAKENSDSMTACQKIGKCHGNEGFVSFSKMQSANDVSESKIKRTLVGTNECTYGPTYWCSTQENAKKCDLVKYCEDNVWKNTKAD